MDPRLQKALEFSNYQETVNTQKKLLKERVKSNLMYGCNGGIFYIDTSLLTFIQSLITLGRIDNVVLLDSNETPVMIEDLNVFKDEIYDRYFCSVQEYFNEYEKIKKSRSIEKLLNL